MLNISGTIRAFGIMIMILCCYSCLQKKTNGVQQGGNSSSVNVSYNDHIKPILSDRCYPCHGPDANAREADLRLDTEAGIIQTILSEGGYPVVPYQPDSSMLIQRIFHQDPDEFMPPPESKMSLTETEKSLIHQWIVNGAVIEPHWSFVPVSKPEIPKVNFDKWPNNEIDHFVLARLERNDLKPMPQAQPEILLRRLFLDLTGLPPSLEDQTQFLKNANFESWVDRLLDDQAFGEKWCWMWLDKARYADTNGFQADPERTMWPWRDWVIKALNGNMPFDQFTIEQLAGDLLPDPTLDNLLATGFNRNHMYNGEGGRIPEETRVENVFDRVETVGKIWMGLTMNCARCHDHKFDPVSQKEYYQMYDFFNQTSETGKNSNGMVEPTLDLSTYILETELTELHNQISTLADTIGIIEQMLIKEPDYDISLVKDLQNIPVIDRDKIQLEKLIELSAGKNPTHQKLLKTLLGAQEKLTNTAGTMIKVMIMDEVDPPRPTAVLVKGTYNQPREIVKMDVPEFLPGLPDEENRNRLTLAKWLIDPQHPLTSRVIVNQFWQELFGYGLVRTPGDFGSQGEKPTHPELLDWLSASFQENWDIKALIKTMVMSATYRQSSKSTGPHHMDDPGNELLSRGPRFRLPSWMIRDQALAISGLLVPEIGGPPVFPYQPDGIWAEATFGFKKYIQDKGDKLYRRTLYSFWRRIVGPTMLFDNAARQVCEVSPLRTNTPLHALVTLNDITYTEAARVMAQNIMQNEITTSEMISTAFKKAVCRSLEPAESKVLELAWQKWKDYFGANPEEAEAYLSVGEFPLDETLDPVNLATFATVCGVILNLDETLTKQ